MTNDQQLEISISEVESLFTEEAGLWQEVEAVTPAHDEERIEKIVDQALHEAVIKETTTFLFSSFTSVLAEFANALLGAVETRHKNLAERQQSAEKKTGHVDPESPSADQKRP